MDGGDDGDGLPGDVHPGKDGGGLADARQPLCQQLRGQIVQLQVEVVLPTRDALILERYMWESTTNPSVKKFFFRTKYNQSAACSKRINLSADKRKHRCAQGRDTNRYCCLNWKLTSRFYPSTTNIVSMCEFPGNSFVTLLSWNEACRAVHVPVCKAVADNTQL